MSEDISILASSRRKHYGTVEPSTACRLKPHKLYHISPGDTLVSIAVKYGTTVQHLKMLNQLWTTDISSLECIKVPDESATSGSDIGSTSQSIELATVTTKSVSRNTVQGEILGRQSNHIATDEHHEVDASEYLKSLFEHAHRAKQCASAVLQNSKFKPLVTNTVFCKRRQWKTGVISFDDVQTGRLSLEYLKKPLLFCASGIADAVNAEAFLN
ncbi:unnamed protein product [Echinostoma caproni]|uniref:LysM domain-containing protein n=1 Tax=Echinostoma caproni TaxID=27848 RepID=A0A183AK09_9TREM|nr:unnamed protein product [Echinostoma caproni]